MGTTLKKYEELMDPRWSGRSKNIYMQMHKELVKKQDKKEAERVAKARDEAGQHYEKGMYSLYGKGGKYSHKRALRLKKYY